MVTDRANAGFVFQYLWNRSVDVDVAYPITNTNTPITMPPGSKSLEYAIAKLGTAATPQTAVQIASAMGKRVLKELTPDTFTSQFGSVLIREGV